MNIRLPAYRILPLFSHAVVATSRLWQKLRSVPKLDQSLTATTTDYWRCQNMVVLEAGKMLRSQKNPGM